MGDGCPYYWRGHYTVWLVGEREFAAKFASKLSVCLGRDVKHYKYGTKNAWFVSVGNAELFFLFKAVRRDYSLVQKLVDEIGTGSEWLLFIEGLFDAEGCVKIIRGEGRPTPKVCLDFCNTNKRLIDLLHRVIRKELGIFTGISKQVAEPPRRTSYHLRIYQKESIATFLQAVSTTKLTPEKRPVVEHWLAKRGRESPSERLSRVLHPRQTN